MFLRHLALASAFAFAIPGAALTAAPQWGSQQRLQPGFQEGYERGVRAGTEDARRGETFRFIDENDYRRADAGYRSQYGNRVRYQDEFKRGFESGYRTGYGRNPVYGNRLPPGRGGQGPWSNGRGVGRYDLAAQQGYNDGYEEGLDDGQDRRRFDPVAESRYRNATRGYEREYGSRELYKANYRTAFRNGYEEGYRDGTTYGRRGF